MRYFMFLLRFLPLLLPLLSIYNIQPTLSSPLSTSSMHLCHHQDSVTLLQFVRNFVINSSASDYYCNEFYGQPAYPKIRSWNHNTDCCFWDGVSCDSLSGHVIGLDLSRSQIQGTIDSNSTLFQLQTLQSLNLACNDFYNSTISPKFGQFPHLKHLNLSHTTFTGKVPLEIARLSRLISLHISSDNNLEMPDLGFITKNMTDLKELLLEDVSVNSVVPRSLVNLSSLTSLTLLNCGLRGNFPTDILHLPHLRNLIIREDGLHANFSGFRWTSPLEVLSLYSLQFAGKLPEPAGQARHLRQLSLSYCNFYGGIPSWVWNVTENIDLSLNQFSGELPSLLNTSMLPRIKNIDLSQNMLSGKIPSWVWDVTESIGLSNNQFSGELPSLLNTSMLPGIKNIDLRGNMLSGKIPSWVWDVTESIGLSNNQFSGELPSLLNTSMLPGIKNIDLRGNMLSGKIPSWVWNVTEGSDLSYNQFSGELPSLLNTSMLSGITSIDLCGNMLSGKISSWIFTLPLLEKLNLRENQFSGQLVIDNYVNISSSLRFIDLSSNMLNETVDFSMFHKSKSLSELYLSNNNISLSFNNSETSTVWPQFSDLVLSSCNLGKFPDFLKDQENLIALDLSKNRIKGQVPHWLLVKNTLSHMDISYNYLTGGLEHAPSNLEYIDLSSNMFRGPLPQLPPSIRAYLVSNNKFTGEIPSTVCNLRSLEFLDLSNNSLTGRIPPCLGNLFDQLFVLNLKLNKFHGTLPQDFTECGILGYLDVNGNQLEGPVPTSLSNCSYLQVIDLGNNKLSGKFPHWLGTLPDLEVLVLRSNRFEGRETEVDYGQTPFPKLRILDIANNQFSGNFPHKLIKSFKAMMNNYKEEREELQYMGDDRLPDNLTYNRSYMFSIALTFKGTYQELDRVMSVETAIDVSGNRFEGDIPIEIADLVSLRWLNLSYNKFSGIIPPSLSNLSMLESLDISSNELVGHIPKELASLTFLELFNASRNQLVGPIPVGKQFDTFGNGSYLENPGLCGTPLSKKCGDDDDDAVEPPSTEYDDSRDISVWDIILMGYACGMVIGLSIGFWVFWGRAPPSLLRLICRVEFIMEQRFKRCQRR